MSNPLALSDEDFLKQSEPPEVASSEVTVASEPGQTQEQNDNTNSQPAVEPPAPETVDDSEEPFGAPEKPAGNTEQGDPSVPESADAANPATTTQPASTEAKPGESTEATQTNQTEASPPNYQALYEQIMKPFKANGREMKLNSPEEAIQLMQMGANYTKRMQDLAPARRVQMMLESNKLSEEDLSFLIDVRKGNKEAIQKLIRDSGIDPMEIDTSTEPAYRGGNHRVSDEQLNFNTSLEDLKSNPEGVNTVRILAAWDQASQDKLWESPQLMHHIHQQREVGIYDRIASEIERRKLLGQISPAVPFIQAYEAVGLEMKAQGKFNDLAPAQAQQTAPTPIAVRTAAPKPVVQNNARVAAAATTRSIPKTAREVSNPLAMSDEEFLKQASGRF